MTHTANRILDDLVGLLDLENLEVNLFRGQSRDLGGHSVFGGQVLGQALMAATRTVDEQVVHSLHGYFLRGGDMEAPIVYEVDRIRDGRSFHARRVQAIQHGRPIFSMIASFHQPEIGLAHAAPMPEVPAPEGLEPHTDLHRRWLAQAQQVSERVRTALTRPLAIEFRPVAPWNQLAPDARSPAQSIWFRAAGKLPEDPALHRAVIAYASDFNLLTTAMLPHRVSVMQEDMVVASLDHAFWFYRTPVADEWMLYTMDSPVAGDARGLSRGLIYDRDGNLIAAVTQESLMRRVGGD